MVLNQGVSPVTFSVANTMKRVAVVVSAVLFFKCVAVALTSPQLLPRTTMAAPSQPLLCHSLNHATPRGARERGARGNPHF
jgi:hypothetical protein